MVAPECFFDGFLPAFEPLLPQRRAVVHQRGPATAQAPQHQHFLGWRRPHVEFALHGNVRHAAEQRRIHRVGLLPAELAFGKAARLRGIEHVHGVAAGVQIFGDILPVDAGGLHHAAHFAGALCAQPAAQFLEAFGIVVEDFVLEFAAGAAQRGIELVFGQIHAKVTAGCGFL